MNGESAERIDTAQELIGTKPRPRVLALGDLPDGVVAYLESVAPTFRAAESSEGISQDEWDLIVTSGSIDGLSPQVPVISFIAPTWAGTIDRWDFQTNEGGISTAQVVQHRSDVRVTEVRQPSPDLPEPLSSLTRQTLIPAYLNDDSKISYFGSWGCEVEPIVQNRAGCALAVIYARTPRTAKRLLLPYDTPKPDAWVRLFVQVILEPSSPLDYRGMRDWSSERTWLTNGELNAVEALRLLRAQKASVLADFARSELELDQKLEESVAKADVGSRRLLTAQGNPLVEAVTAAFEQIGFRVENVDENEARRGDALEDLRIYDDHDDEDWVALVEVRGYGGGAKLSDLVRMTGRFLPRYITDTGRRPDRLWLVVNHHLNEPPSSRERPLVSNPDELEEFSRGDGLVLDTRALFEAQREVEADPSQASATRERLKACTGVLVDFGLPDWQDSGDPTAEPEDS